MLWGQENYSSNYDFRINLALTRRIIDIIIDINQYLDIS